MDEQQHQQPGLRNLARFTKKIPPPFASDKAQYPIWLKDLGIWLRWRDEAIEPQDIGMLVYTQLSGHAQQIVQRLISDNELQGLDEDGEVAPDVMGKPWE